MLGFRAALVLVLLAAALGTAASASAAGTVGTTFPAGFAVPTDASLGTPVLGFGAAGPVHRTPVIVLHGNNDTPYPTPCNPYGDVHSLAQYLVDNGYTPSEVWGLGYQGDQCDFLADPTNRSGAAHTTVANIPDLDAFVRSVLKYTHAKQVDIVGHSLGGTLARAWMKADHTQHLVRRLVQIDAPNHGIIDCSPDPANYWQLPANGGFTPSSPVCQEYGSPRTPFLRWLNGHGHGQQGGARQDRRARHPQRGQELRLLPAAGRPLPGRAGDRQLRGADRLLAQRRAARRRPRSASRTRVCTTRFSGRRTSGSSTRRTRGRRRSRSSPRRR